MIFNGPICTTYSQPAILWFPCLLAKRNDTTPLGAVSDVQHWKLQYFCGIESFFSIFATSNDNLFVYHCSGTTIFSSVHELQCCLCVFLWIEQLHCRWLFWFMIVSTHNNNESMDKDRGTTKRRAVGMSGPLAHLSVVVSKLSTEDNFFKRSSCPLIQLIFPIQYLRTTKVSYCLHRRKIVSFTSCEIIAFTTW